MPSRIKKREAIDKVNKRFKTHMLTLTNTRFANINSRKEVWWLDIPLRCIKANSQGNIHLILYNYRTKELHHLNVPSAFFLKNIKGLVVREDKDIITLELAVEATRQFQDARPMGSGINFSQFLTRR